jgi:aspartate 1-decarboxylase
MQRKMLLGKIHRATVTEANLHYQGSITIDADLLEGADILEYESVDVWNITSGERFSTYAITGGRGSGTICINGAAAHKAGKGDLVIIGHFGWMDDARARKHKPRIVQVDEHNQPVEVSRPGAESAPEIEYVGVSNMLI